MSITRYCTYLCLTLSALISLASNHARANSHEKLMAGQSIFIHVLGEGDLSNLYQISDSGYINFPLLGKVPAAYYTAHELERFLTKELKGDYLLQPDVKITRHTQAFFYIIGAVEKPGQYPLHAGMNVLSAVATAGGYTRFAKTKKVDILRNDHGGETPEIKRDYQTMPATTLLQSGDVIYVKTSWF